MSLESDMGMLRRVPFLSDFTDDRLRLLAFSSDNRSYANGQNLFSAGDRADAAFVVVRGKVAIMPPREDIRPAAVFGPGSIVGELALVVEGVRSMSAVALGAVDAIQIRRPTFLRMLEEFPEIPARLQTRIAESLRGTMAELRDVGERLAHLG